MITGIFGAVGTEDKNILSDYLTDHRGYGVNHTCMIRDIEGGQLGMVLIGENNGDLQDIQLQTESSLVVCADAVIYNRDELVKTLQVPPGSGNAELLAQAFKKWEYRCVEFLSGDFAFAIWNKNKRELFCARDHIGIRPFYYCRLKEGLVFASEINIIKLFLKNRLKLNREYFLDTLITVISDRSETAFEGICRLPPAHHLVYNKGHIQIKNYWTPDPEERIRYRDDEEYTSHFLELLSDAVAKRCRGTGRTGSELSGGLDSTAVTCIASGMCTADNKPFAAFSNTLPADHHTVMKDEREHMLKVLDWIPLNWHEVNRSGTGIRGLIDHSLAVQGCFTQQRFHMFNRGIYEAAAKSGVSVLLSGFGGDEMVSARTGNAWNDLLREHQWRHYYEALTCKTSLPKALMKGIKTMLKYQVNKYRQQGSTSGLFTPRMLKQRFATLPLNSRFVQENGLDERYFGKYERKAGLYLSDRLIQKINHPHVPQRLEYSYAAAAYYGIQYRYPLLDTKLIRTFLSFPSWIKNRPGIERYLFRQALKGRIPESIRLRADKTGAVIPHTYLRLKHDRELLTAFFRRNASNPVLKQFFDFSRFESWMDSLLERNPDEMNYLMPGAFYNYLMIISWFDKNCTIL